MSSPSATRSKSKARDPRSVELWRRADGTFGCLSSDGITIYSVRPVAGGWQCQCLGFAARRSCCHSKAVSQVLVCQWCDSIEHTAEYINGWDNGAILVLCDNCSPLREVA